MNPFKQTLQNLNHKLDLPQPTKSRIILEIAADLDDLYQHYLSAGASEQEAIQQAADMVDLSDEALEQLVSVHQTAFQKLLDKISLQAQSMWERTVLMFVLVVIATFATHAMTTTQFFLEASKFVWGVAGIGVVAIGLSIYKFYAFYIKRTHHTRTLHSGLTTLILLAGFSILIGVMGNFTEVFLVQNKITFFAPFLIILLILSGLIPVLR
ncbi:hypothetical protein JW960_04435 [candidate division KSB1 bacterium]|nr:hypothetical protein [candidate division KSB1 bacterium]